MTVTHPHLLEKAVRSETSESMRHAMAVCEAHWGMEDVIYKFPDTISLIRADYKRRVQKKGKRA